MGIITKKKRLSKFLQLIDCPDPLHSLEDFYKFNHADLFDMSKTELQREKTRVEMALAMLDRDKIIYITPEGDFTTAEDWLQERLKKIIAELKMMQKTRSRPAQAKGGAHGWI